MAQITLPERIQKRLSDLPLKIEIHNSPVPEIERLINQGLVLGGKRIRPLLSFLVADWIGVEEKIASTIARAAEYTHAASLAHDDVLDESDFRRNKPTLRKLSSNSRAVLAGDLLLSRTLREIAELKNIELVTSLTLSAEALVYGEWLQQELYFQIDVESSNLHAVHLRKTASLMEWACIAPAIIKKTENPDDPRWPLLIENLKQMGRYIGLAFQLTDDVVDFSQDSQKPFAQDLREGLINTVTLKMLQQNPELKTPIKNLMGKENTHHAFPWSEAQLQRALSSINEEAQGKIFAAKKILDASKEFCPMNDDIQKAFESLFLLLGDRKT